MHNILFQESQSVDEDNAGQGCSSEKKPVQYSKSQMIHPIQPEPFVCVRLYAMLQTLCLSPQLSCLPSSKAKSIKFPHAGKCWNKETMEWNEQKQDWLH